eukprot:gnl/TRDRNA2_/TRDRNA2_196896_c0_seq1.p1 gnl/TRDRNA2_/TRDRNA2_196896_c0~~gnl/TRDRNA2_/TRDRNA2_196896_c0_seq1.p1  ORF type:complete len:153 (-),score=25.66 gnl/TRDRNA2_/TRDRNA2_196896_c0_seq1:43-501(-)
MGQRLLRQQGQPATNSPCCSPGAAGSAGPVVLHVNREKGERFGAKLQWSSGPPTGLRIVAVLPGSPLERAARAEGMDVDSLAKAVIVEVNGITGNQRRMDSELDTLRAELVIHPLENDAAPLLSVLSPTSAAQVGDTTPGSMVLGRPASEPL